MGCLKWAHAISPHSQVECRMNAAVREFTPALRRCYKLMVRKTGSNLPGF